MTSTITHGPSAILEAVHQVSREHFEAPFLLRVLTAQDATLIVRHFQSLAMDDQLLRFGHPVHFELLTQYVHAMQFETDVVLGLFCNHMLIGVCHLAMSAQSETFRTCEMGISVCREYQGVRLGAKLMCAAIVEAARQHMTCIHVQFLRRNRPIYRLCKKLNASIEVDGQDCVATIQLTSQTRAGLLRFSDTKEGPPYTLIL